MNIEEAKQVLGDYLLRYKNIPYEELVDSTNEIDTYEEEGPTGTTYYLEFQILKASKMDDGMYVLGSIDAGGMTGYSPLNGSFVMKSDGSIIHAYDT